MRVAGLARAVHWGTPPPRTGDEEGDVALPTGRPRHKTSEASHEAIYQFPVAVSERVLRLSDQTPPFKNRPNLTTDDLTQGETTMRKFLAALLRSLGAQCV